jgi:prevent-host-death family protein
MGVTMYIGGMAQRSSIAEARLHLSTIVDEVEAGQEVALTRRGETVAVVLSLCEFERLRNKRGNFGAAYEAFLQEHALNESGLESSFAASVHDRSRGHESRQRIRKSIERGAADVLADRVVDGPDHMKKVMGRIKNLANKHA